MTSGGSRNRSGPGVDPNSGRSDRRGVTFSALPAEGYTGRVPAFPLPERVVWVETVDLKTGARGRKRADAATKAVRRREMQLWRWAWRTPQAAAWALPSESWRLHTIAMWVRTYVLCESSEATAADKGSLHRFADQIGLTPAGLRENGWAVAADAVGAKSAEKKSRAKAEPAKRERRLRAVDA